MTINQRPCHIQMVGAEIDFYNSFDQLLFNKKEEMAINDGECYIKIFWWRMDFDNPFYRVFGGKYRWCDWHKRFHS